MTGPHEVQIADGDTVVCTVTNDDVRSAGTGPDRAVLTVRCRPGSPPAGPGRARSAPTPAMPRPARRPGVSTSRSPTSVRVQAEHVEPAQHRLGDLRRRSGRVRRVGRRYDAERDGLPRLERLGELVVVAGREHARGRPRAPRRPRRAAGRAACRPRRCAPTARRPRRRSRRAPSPAPREASGGCTVRCRPKPDAVGTAPASTAASAGSSTCTTSRSPPGSRRRTSATWSRSPSASAWASSRRAPKSASTLSPRGRSTVAASVHGPATWTLNAPA